MPDERERAEARGRAAWEAATKLPPPPRWSPEFDMASIPDDVLRSEWARRNARKRQSYTGGVVWAKHNPDVPGCRCKACMKRRGKL